MSNSRFRLHKYYYLYFASWINRVRRCIPINRSLLIAKFDGIGDLFLILPVLRKLLDTGYHITMAGAPFQKEVLAHCNLPVDTITFDRTTLHSLKHTIAKASLCKPEYAINLSMNAWGGILVNHSRSPHMIGLLQEPEWYVYKGTHLLYDRTITYETTLHGFDTAWRLFNELLGIAPVEPFLELPTSENGIIIIHPYSSWEPRRWPGFIDLIRRLVDKKCKIIVLGTAMEHETGGIVAHLPRSENCMPVKVASVTHLMHIIDACHFFIGNDSGPAHYASIIGKPTFVLWGPGNFDRVRPLGKNLYFFKKDIACRPCRQRGNTCKKGTSECLRAISVDEVMETVCSRIGFSKTLAGPTPATSALTSYL